jgi:hypothetical protein
MTLNDKILNLIQQQQEADRIRDEKIQNIWETLIEAINEMQDLENIG